MVLPPVWPNVGVHVWYQKTLDKLIKESTAELVRDLKAAWKKTPPLFLNSHITAAYGDAALGLDSNAAGVIFICEDKCLLLHRTDGQGWAFPGGTIEPDETPEAAARREAFEETLYAYNGLLYYLHTQTHGNVRFGTYIGHVLEPFEPRLNPEHDAAVWVNLDEALRLPLHPGARRTLKLIRSEALSSEGIVAMDAPSPTKALQIALAKWGSQTIKKFNLMSDRIANDFATRSKNATQAAMMGQLKKAGFSIAFKPTRESMAAFKAVVRENVDLIKSIPRQYHDQVEKRVYEAVSKGSDLDTLSKQLRKAHDITVNRAALIARDQNAKAKAVIERVRQAELGINRGYWMHSHAGKQPRPTHVEMDNKPYNLAKGFWDRDENEWVHPGQLINCRCTMRPILEGYND